MKIEIAPKSAIARRPATRETALLTPDAAPTWRSSSTDVITVVVSGATVVAIPITMTIRRGQNDVQYEPPMPGNANSANPVAAINGPKISGNRGPIRSANAPVKRESNDIAATSGSNAAPVRAGE